MRHFVFRRSSCDVNRFRFRLRYLAFKASSRNLNARKNQHICRVPTMIYQLTYLDTLTLRRHSGTGCGLPKLSVPDVHHAVDDVLIGLA